MFAALIPARAQLYIHPELVLDDGLYPKQGEAVWKFEMSERLEVTQTPLLPFSPSWQEDKKKSSQ